VRAVVAQADWERQRRVVRSIELGG